VNEFLKSQPSSLGDGLTWTSITSGVYLEMLNYVCPISNQPCLDTKTDMVTHSPSAARSTDAKTAPSSSPPPSATATSP